MTDFSAKRQPKITDSRRRATRCTRAQDKAAEEFNLTRLEVQLGRKIDRDAPVITVQDHKVTYTLCKVYVDSYRIEGIPTLRSRKRPRVEGNMNRYNDPAPSRYYNQRDRDYDPYYPPNNPVQQFERRQVAKKSTAQQAQVHQYAYKRSAGPDFNRSAYNQHQDAKRPRMAHGGQDRYSRSMRPPDYTPNGVNRGGNAWSRGSSSSRYPQRDHFERRGPGRPRLDKRKDDWADDGWRESDRFRDDDQKNRQTRSRSSERGRPINTRAEESNRSHSQGPSTRSRPKSSQGNDNKSNAITLPKSNQGKSSKVKGDENESKPMQGSDKISGQSGTSSSASKPPSMPKTNTSDASENNEKIKQVPSAIKLKANARKSTYSPGKVKPSDEQGIPGPDPDVEWKVLSEEKGSPSPGRKPTTKSDISDDTKQTRSPRVNHVDGRGSALDNALRIERMRKAEEAKNTVEDSTNATKQPVITNSAPDTSERAVDEGNFAAQNKSSVAITRTASRKLMPVPSLARKVSPTSARKTMAISSNQSKSNSTESTKDAPQTQKTSAKQGMARKSAPKSVNHKGTPPFLPFGPQKNEGDEDGSKVREQNAEKESETQKAAEKIHGSTEQANGPVLSSLATNKPITDRSNLTARKSAPRLASPSKSCGEGNPSTVNQPCKTSSILPPTNTDVSADQTVNPSSDAYDASQSARTVPFKQQQSSKKPGPIVQPKPTVQSSPTARKSAPPSEQTSKKRPEIRMPIQNRLEIDDITEKPTGAIPTVKMPASEKQNNSPEVKYAIVEGNEGVQAAITGSAKNKPKGVVMKTLNLSVFKKEKLKNIVGKVAAKMEARSAGDISPSAGNGPVPMKLDQDKEIVEKELAAVKENLQELQNDLVDKGGKIEVKTKVEEFQVSGEKLQVCNMAGVLHRTKSELETKESEVKQEAKCPVVLKVPQIIPKDSQDTKPPNAAIKLDIADPVQTTTKVKEINTGNVASTMLHLAKLASQDSPVEKELSSEPPCQEQVAIKTSVPTINTLQKPPQMNRQSKSPDLVKLTSTTNSNTTTTEESKSKSSGVTAQVAKKSAAVIDKIGVSNTLVVTTKGLVNIGDVGATNVEGSVNSKCNERLPSEDKSKAKSTKQHENAVYDIEKKPLKDGDQTLTEASKEVSLSANSNASSPAESSSENPTVSEGVNVALVCMAEVNVENMKPQLKPAETVTNNKPSIDENKETKTSDPSLTIEKDKPVKNATKGSTEESPDGSNRNSGECQKNADMTRTDTPSDNRNERNNMAQASPHLSEQSAGHSARSVSSDKLSHVSMETNEKVPQVASSFSVHSPGRLNSDLPATITLSNEEILTTAKVTEKSTEGFSPTTLNSDKPINISQEKLKTKPESERKSAEGPSPASVSSNKSPDAIKEAIEKPYAVPQFEMKSAVARSPGRKSREGDSSDDALLNSSTNDSAEEPMEVDGDSEMEDYLLADDEVQNKEEKRDQAVDIHRDADPSLTKSKSAKDLVKHAGEEGEGMSTLPEASQPSSMPIDTSNETNSASSDISVPKVTEANLGIQIASTGKTDTHQDIDQPPTADIDSGKDTDKSKATSSEVSERTPSLPAVSLHSPPEAIDNAQNANSVETGIIPEQSKNESTSVVQDELTQKTENHEIDLVPSSSGSSVEQSSTHANQPSTHLANTESHIHGASDAQLNDNIPSASEKGQHVSNGPEITKDAVKSSESPIAKDINIVESKTAKSSKTETTVKLPSDEKKLPVILSVTSKDIPTNSPNTSISVTILEAPTITKLKDVTLVNTSKKPSSPKSTEDDSVQESSEKMPLKSTGDIPLKGNVEETSLKSVQNSSGKLTSEKTPSKSTDDTPVEIVSGKMPLKSAEHLSGKGTSEKTVSLPPQSTENTLVKVTSDTAVPSKSTADVLGKVTSEKTLLPKKPSEEQSKSSRSATPSAESAGESGVDIIELSSDEDAASASSAATHPKPKKKKIKSKSSTELHGKSGKRSASPLSDGKENKKAKLDGSEKQDVLSPNLSKQELVAKLIEIKMRQHLKRVNELAAKAKILQDQLTAAENSRQRWQIESTRLQIKVHELTEQNDILRSKRKEVPSKVVVTTGTQYDRQDVLQAQQLLAAKQSASVVPTMQTSTSQRMPQQQPPQSSNKEVTTLNSVPPNRSVASDASKSNQQIVLTSSRAAAAPQTRPLNASSQASASTTTTNVTAATSGSGSKTPSTPGSTPTKQPSNRCGWQQSQPLNLHSPSISPTATPFGVNATTRPSVPTAKPADVRAKLSATRRPSGSQTKSSEPVAVIDLTDDDDAAAAAAAAAAANKNKVPLNPVRTPPVTQPSRISQQNVPSKSPPVAHRTTPPRPVPPGPRQSPTVPNILRNKVVGQSATSQVEEFRQAAQRQQKQVQILQKQVSAMPTLQQRQVQQPQRSVAAQQAPPNLQVVHTSQQARVSPMQSSSRSVTVSTGGTRQIVSLPANNLAATAAIASRATAPQILQQSNQQQVVQHQVLQQQASVVQQQIVQQQVVSPGQAAQIIQTPAGQVVMTPMSSAMTTVLTTQPIQAGAVHPGQLTTYQIQTVPGQTIQNASTVQQMLMQQQQQSRTAQVVQQQQQQVATRFTAPANSLQPSSSVQQTGHVIHHRGNTSRPPHTTTRPTHPNALQQQPPPPYQQRRPSFSDPGTVRAVAAPPVTVATSAVASTADVQQQFAQIQAQISHYEALAQNMQQSIQKLKEEDAPYEKRRIEILKELQMGNLGTYRTQDLHMQLRHIQNEQTRIQTESKSKVNLMQQYLHSKHQLQQSIQQHQRQQAVQQSQQQQAVQPTVQQQQQQQIVQVSQPNRTAVTQITASNSTTATSQSSQVAVRRHPAPLPSVPNSAYTVASNAAPPPKPSLSISKVNQGIVLSWNMTINTAVHAAIDFYNLYAYQETDAPPNTSLWKKIGEVKALPLPMACTLTQFQPGSMYHFAVCAIDVYHRTGPFSDPSSINLPAI